jgi:DNA-binding LytR/AlgR family response regulator
VVFVSAFQDYAIKAIRSEVYDFVLKPADREQLKALIEKYKRRNRKDLPGMVMQVLSAIKEENKIRINSRHSYILLNPEEIIYCMAEDGYITIYLTNGRTEIANTSLTALEQKVNAHNFYRLGRSVLLNLDQVRCIDKIKNTICFSADKGETTIVASRNAIKELLFKVYNYA